MITLTDHKSGCLACGRELIYSDEYLPAHCHYCGEETGTNTRCTQGHYVCDACHSGSALDLIERYCVNTGSTDPISMAVILMKSPAVKMHGPEHHFLVPAVLLAAYYNFKGLSASDKAEKIRLARKRAEDVKGGFCGFLGTCGAAIGTGMFISLITGATPLSQSEWRLSNLMTSESLKCIAEHGGPRCCKRDTFLAIHSAIDFLKRELKAELPFDRRVDCSFSAINKECLKENCPFFKSSC